MKRILNCFLVVLLVLTLVLSGTLTAFGAETNSVKVQYNGENIQLTKEAKIINGRTMLPFRQIFEAMGIDVAYDAATKTVTASTTEKTVSFAVGNTALTIDQDGAVSTETMETAPFIDPATSSTYVQVRTIAESFGKSVGWDATNKTVIIIDPDTIFANANEDFSIICKLMKTGLDLEKSYKTDGSFDMNITTYATADSVMPPISASVSGTISGVQQKSNADLAMNLAINFDEMLKSLSAEEQAQLTPLTAMFKNVDMKIKMNGDTGETYMNSNMFSVMDPTVTTNTWYKTNVYDTYDSMGIDLKSLSSMNYSNLDISDVLSSTIATLDYADTSTYKEMKTSYEFFKNLIGDDAFKSSTSGTVTTYTLNLDKASILSSIAKTELTEGVSADMLDMTDTGEMLSSADFGASLTIKEKNDSLYQYTLEGDFAYDGASCTFDMSGDQKNTDANFTLDMTDMMKMVMNMESHLAETSQAPDLSLPADAVIVDYPVYPSY